MMIFLIGFQDSATPVMEGIVDLHNHITFFLVLFTVFVCWVFGNIVYEFLYLIQFPQNKVDINNRKLLNNVRFLTHGATIGHQWYWSYEYSDYNYEGESGELSSIGFDSYMLPEDDLNIGDFRLLEVDNQVVLPTQTHIRVIVTAADVLHSWSVNSLGVKVDAVPGRLNQTAIFIKREGTYYGQCSEICGVNHGFMPIVVKAVSVLEYKAWLLSV
jgi:cytochrome c oxidase subunit 2